MARLTYVEAIVAAIAAEMRRDPRVFLLGQDIGPLGGVMRGARGLWEEFGDARVLDTPISESAMVGAAVGAALMGKRPIVEISFGEFLPLAMSQLVLQAANIHYMTAGAASVPMVVRTRIGDGPYRGHPQCYEAWLAHVPGLKAVLPATPYDARGLMTAAIRDPNPVIVFEHMQLYHLLRDEVPDEDYEVPIGQAVVAREGRDATVVATGWMVHRALAAADALTAEGMSVEVVDLRSLAPLDIPTVVASVRKTSRLVIAHESWKVGGIGAEVSASIAEEAVDALDAPIVRVGAPHAPVPSARSLRDLFLPDEESIRKAVRKVAEF
ncbi:MAG: alpha-ketoacid dehydrogenase subunit beta [Chloroflexi bacterium]|nr:alpha-ketoacid dehydrogenase subunit beta [Chloroflexota bacterium]